MKELTKLTEIKKMAAASILQKIKDKAFDATELQPVDRRRIVSMLRHEYTEAQIAQYLEVSDSTVARDVKKLKIQGAKLVANINLDEVVGELMRKAEILYAKAIRAKDYSFAWKVECDLIEKLQSLNVLHVNPDALKKGVQVQVNTAVTNNSQEVQLNVGDLSEYLNEMELKVVDGMLSQALERKNFQKSSLMESDVQDN